MATAPPRTNSRNRFTAGTGSVPLAWREQPTQPSDDVLAASSESIRAVAEDRSAANHARQGLAAAQTARHTEALLHFARAVQLEPNSAEYCCQFAWALRRAGHAEQAALAYETAVTLCPEWYAAWHNQGEVQRELGRFELAVAAYQRALAINPHAYESYVNSAETLADLGQFTTAHRLLDTAQALRPDRLETHLSRAAILRQQGQLRQAERILAAGNSRDPEWRYNLALTRIESGEFSTGWRGYDDRWQTRLAGGRPPRLLSPRWRGEPLAGRSIRVRGEQGLGDEILFASCLPDLLAEADQVQLTCDARLQSMFARSFPQVRVEPRPSHFAHDPQEQEACLMPPLGMIDYEVPAGSLPRYFRTHVADFPQRDQFLVADPTRRRRWQQRLDAHGTSLKVGLAWRAGRNGRDVRRRSVPLDQLAALREVSGIQWISLQHGAVEGEREALMQQDWSFTESVDFTQPESLEELAACIAELDLVVAVAGTAIHLAGALGTPAWCWLPPEGGWRWTRGQERSLWYPAVRVRWAREVGCWTDLVGQVAADLVALRPCRRHARELPP